MSEENPYQVREETLGVDLEGIDDEVVRGRFIREEVCVVAVGWFYYCMAAFQLAMVVGVFLFVDWKEEYFIGLGVAILCMTSVLFIVIAYGMRHFYEWSRRPSVVAAVLGMFMFPVGTLAGIYCILLLRRNTVEEIFTERYRAIIAKENYKSLGWLAFVVGVLLAISFWGMLFLLDDFGIDWNVVEKYTDGQE